MLRPIALVLGLVFACLSSSAWSQWGDLTGRFVYDGDPPEAKPVVISQDAHACANHGLKEEFLAVHPENRGLANVVVSIYVPRGSDSPTHHPDYAQSATAEVRLDNEHCRFEPHVQLLRTSQTLVLGNQDQVTHNTKIDTISNPQVNPVIPAGGEFRHQFSKPERYPAPVSCSIHPWMNARLVIRDSPYMAVTDRDGKFTIKNLPEGEWTFQVWHETCGNLSAVSLNGEPTEWRRGRFPFLVQAGVNDLGEIRVNPSVLKKR